MNPALDTCVGNDLFIANPVCWICGAGDWEPFNEELFRFDFDKSFIEHDDIRRYEGQTFMLQGCRSCGFIQPDRLPSMTDYFDKLYDRQWTKPFLDQDFDNGKKDLIFRRLAKRLARQIGHLAKTLPDV